MINRKELVDFLNDHKEWSKKQAEWYGGVIAKRYDTVISTINFIILNLDNLNKRHKQTDKELIVGKHQP